MLQRSGGLASSKNLTQHEKEGCYFEMRQIKKKKYIYIYIYI